MLTLIFNSVYLALVPMYAPLFVLVAALATAVADASALRTIVRGLRSGRRTVRAERSRLARNVRFAVDGDQHEGTFACNGRTFGKVFGGHYEAAVRVGTLPAVCECYGVCQKCPYSSYTYS